jgi:hypothetical protein
MTDTPTETALRENDRSLTNLEHIACELEWLRQDTKQESMPSKLLARIKGIEDYLEEARDEDEFRRQRIAELEESLHLANGTADLAMKHRDMAEKEATLMRGLAASQHQRIKKLEESLNDCLSTLEAVELAVPLNQGLAEALTLSCNRAALKALASQLGEKE